MKYYKHSETGEVFAYESEQERQEWGAPELVEMTPEEIDAHINPPVTVEQAKARKHAEINAAFSDAATALTDGYPDAEKLTWPVQQQEALAWDADNNSPTPYLDSVASARGIDEVEMRQLTLAQVQAFRTASAGLVGTRQRLRDQIDAAESVETVESIQWPDQ